jgi:hypothetical protein
VNTTDKKHDILTVVKLKHEDVEEAIRNGELAGYLEKQFDIGAENAFEFITEEVADGRLGA